MDSRFRTRMTGGLGSCGFERALAFMYEITSFAVVDGVGARGIWFCSVVWKTVWISRLRGMTGYNDMGLNPDNARLRLKGTNTPNTSFPRRRESKSGLMRGTMMGMTLRPPAFQG